MSRKIETSKAVKIEIFKDYYIEAIVNNKGGCVSSNLKTDNILSEEDNEYNAAIDGIESLFLALLCAGLDVNSIDVTGALETAVNKVNCRFD